MTTISAVKIDPKPDYRCRDINGQPARRFSDRNPDLTPAAGKNKNIQVLETILGGKSVYFNNHPN